MVESTGLLNRCRVKPYRRFESCPLRFPAGQLTNSRIFAVVLPLAHFGTANCAKIVPNWTRQDQKLSSNLLQSSPPFANSSREVDDVRPASPRKSICFI